MIRQSIRQRIRSTVVFASAIMGFAVAVSCVVKEAPPPQPPQEPISNEAAPGDGEDGYDDGYGGDAYGGYGYGGDGYGGYGYGGSGYGGSGYGGY